jgi:hypothetical protein
MTFKKREKERERNLNKGHQENPSKSILKGKEEKGLLLLMMMHAQKELFIYLEVCVYLYICM